MTYILGTKLSDQAKAEVLNKFVNRFTGDHVPSWVNTHGSNYPVQFVDDADWLAHTFFHATKKGTLAKGDKPCRSFPTWPNNPEYRDGSFDKFLADHTKRDLARRERQRRHD